jgi:hypothetical protein
MDTVFGRRRPDSIAVEWNSKVLYVLEFKRTSDQRRYYRERGKPVHGLNTTSSSKASRRWQEKQSERIVDGKSNYSFSWEARVDQYMYKRSIITSENLGFSSPKETQSEEDSCTSCLMHKTRYYAHTSHKGRVRGVRDGTGKGRDRERTVEEAFQGLDYFE